MLYLCFQLCPSASALWEIMEECNVSLSLAWLLLELSWRVAVFFGVQVVPIWKKSQEPYNKHSLAELVSTSKHKVIPLPQLIPSAYVAPFLVCDTNTHQINRITFITLVNSEDYDIGLRGRSVKRVTWMCVSMHGRGWEGYVGDSGNRDIQLASRNVLSDFTDDTPCCKRYTMESYWPKATIPL